MTVKELIEKLKKMPPELRVVSACKEGYYPDSEIETVIKRKYCEFKGETTEDIISID